jgi:thymidylate synthase
MRSNDFLLGHPFNVSSYAALLAMVAKITGYKPGKVVYSCGDAHIYKPHIEPLEIQMNRPHHEYTRLVIKDRGQKEITDFVYDDFELVGYDELNSGKLKAEMFT